MPSSPHRVHKKSILVTSVFLGNGCAEFYNNKIVVLAILYLFSCEAALYIETSQFQGMGVTNSTTIKLLFEHFYTGRETHLTLEEEEIISEIATR